LTYNKGQGHSSKVKVSPGELFTYNYA